MRLSDEMSGSARLDDAGADHCRRAMSVLLPSARCPAHQLGVGGREHDMSSVSHQRSVANRRRAIGGTDLMSGCLIDMSRDSSNGAFIARLFLETQGLDLGRGMDSAPQTRETQCDCNRSCAHQPTSMPFALITPRLWRVRKWINALGAVDVLGWPRAL